MLIKLVKKIRKSDSYGPELEVVDIAKDGKVWEHGLMS